MRVKTRVPILERAYDKASKFGPGRIGSLAELEASTLLEAIRYGREKAEPERKLRRDAIWKHFGWDTPEAEAKWQRIREGIINGNSL
jgi:hypothetical protein